MEKNRHMPYRIRKIEEENETVRTFEFDSGSLWGEVKPGNFVMTWIPDVSENPFSVADINPLKIMVKKVGDDSSFTSQMFRKVEGDEIFIKGPLGNSFQDYLKDDRKSYVIAGGIGLAPLLCLMKYSLKPDNTRVWMGFKTKGEVIYPVVLPVGFAAYTITTDDGTYGKKGLITDLFEGAEIEEGSQFFICGPEKMMETTAKKAMNYTDPEYIILSTERYIKCGCSMCGSCEIKGSEHTYSVCADGPIFTYKQLMDGDFGRFHRTRSGRKIPV